MTEISVRVRRELKDLYHLSPILWAVVRGCDGGPEIARRLAKPVESIERGIRSAVQAGLLRRDEGRLVPLSRHHRELHRSLNPAIQLGSNHPVMDLIGDQTLTTSQIAVGLGRPYHSVYKTLQRMEARGHLTRVNKLWRHA
jgi:predicted Rossmann fold nucleotide-binding protein DprA/Smf involved in DNA uptake